MVCHSFPSVSIAKQQAHHGRITRLRNARHLMSIKRGRMELRSHNHFKFVLLETLPPTLGLHYRGSITSQKHPNGVSQAIVAY